MHLSIYKASASCSIRSLTLDNYFKIIKSGLFSINDAATSEPFSAKFSNSASVAAERRRRFLRDFRVRCFTIHEQRTSARPAKQGTFSSARTRYFRGKNMSIFAQFQHAARHIYVHFMCPADDDGDWKWVFYGALIRRDHNELLLRNSRHKIYRPRNTTPRSHPDAKTRQ